MKRFTTVLAMITGIITINGASSAKAGELTVDAWPSTVYYLALLSGPNAPYEDVMVNITAVDEYTLYVNGMEIGSETIGPQWTHTMYLSTAMRYGSVSR